MASTPAKTASEVLESLNLQAPPSFAAFLNHLYQQRYSGPVTFHFQNGVAQVVELTQRVQVPLERGPKPLRPDEHLTTPGR